MFNKITLATLIAAAAAVSGSAHAALDSTLVTAVQTEVLADAETAFGSGMAVLTVVLAMGIGMGLLSRFINKGANG